MERLLSVSRELRDKVQHNESAAGELLRQCEELREELRSMRQWREVVPSAEDNHVQMPNIEFKYIKQLQAENAELRVLLEEHQAAIEMIMTKYRQQVSQFIETSKEEKRVNSDTTAEELLHRTDQLYHMAAVVTMTMQDDEVSSQKTVEYISQLEFENKHLRELLHFTQSGVLDTAAITTDSSLPTHHHDQALPPRNIRPLTSAGSKDATYVPTPIGSGQATPIATPTPAPAGEQLQQVCDKLNMQ